ncbi:MAG: redox-sensing transcriptional repressor Rex [Clostridia bacterium]|nr:redox-sensing transcriptional repressor Rex [Clostridia bacterium]
MDNDWLFTQTEKDIQVSEMTIRRLPRYFRYLRELVEQGRIRISSAELSKMMNVTASQIRSDLNQLGDFGHMGYGYDVNYLFKRISEILGVREGMTAVIIDSGDLGRALVQTTLFVRRGIDVLALFDGIGDRAGTAINDIPIISLSKLETFCETHKVDIAVLTCPKEQAQVISQRAADCGVRGIWNYTGRELHPEGHPQIIIENVHLGDSLMILDYKLRTQDKRNGSEKANV